MTTSPSGKRARATPSPARPAASKKASATRKRAPRATPMPVAPSKEDSQIALLLQLPIADGQDSPAADPPDKPPKDKLVRDSFTIPASEYAVLNQLKQRSISLAHPARKSEVLRAGLMALATLDDSDLLAALACVPTVKTGRPKERKIAKKA